MRHSEDEKPQHRANAYIRYSGLATQMIVSVLMGTWLGQWLDEYLAMSFPLFTVVLSLTFLSGSFYLLIRDLQKDNK